MSDARTQEAIEGGILRFRRERVQDGVHLARIAIRPGETSTPHYHPSTQDTFYVMSGVLTVTVEVSPDDVLPPYQSLCAAPPEVVRAENGKHVHRLRVRPGEVLVVNPFAVHCASNAGDSTCSFLCIEGVGDYKFVQVPSSVTASP
jgi:quercetin dioxygenase-like cupin family protein